MKIKSNYSLHRRLAPGGLIYQISEKGVMINVKVIPKSSKSEVAGVQNGFLKLKLCSPPEKGKANAECQRLLAGIFDLAKNQIMLVSGEKKQQKTFLIDNVDEPGFLESINRCINH